MTFIARLGRSFGLAAILLAPRCIAQGQVHLITGAFNQGWTRRYGSALFAVDASGKITKKLDLVTQGQGFSWLGISSELKLAATIVPGDPPSIRFLNLDTAEVTKDCGLPEFLRPGIDGLAYAPGKSATLQISDSRDHTFESLAELYELVADPAISCEKSLKRVAVQRERYAVMQGYAGVGDFVMADNDRWAHVSVDTNGNLLKMIDTRTWVLVGFKLPMDLLVGTSPSRVGIVVNNSQIFVAVAGYDPHARMLVLKKSDKTWHVIPESSLPAGVRAFGKYVAFTEASLKPTVAAELKESGRVNINEQVMKEIGPGEKEWRDSEGPMGPNQVESFANSELRYPGRLRIFDAATEKVYTITTNQGDSEILLIESGTVYYRVSDRLYRASISDEGLGEARLIATDEIVRDAHWAFLTR